MFYWVSDCFFLLFSQIFQQGDSPPPAAMFRNSLKMLLGGKNRKSNTGWYHGAEFLQSFRCCPTPIRASIRGQQ